jgi:hypothetical protein
VWEWFDADVPVSSVSIIRNDVVVWDVMGGPTATTITIPELPSTADPAQIHGSSPRAVVYGGVPNDDGLGSVRWERLGGLESTSYCQHYADAAFGCRSTGGGSENRKVCVP